MKYKDLPRSPIETTIKMIGCRWKILIIKYRQNIGGIEEKNKVIEKKYFIRMLYLNILVNLTHI